MRILLVSKFLHHVGGVETYLGWEAEALTEAGHEVALVGMTIPRGQAPINSRLPTWTTPPRDFAKGSKRRVRSAAASLYSPAAGAVVAGAIAQFSPDVVHFHGTCYQLTSSVVRAATRAGTRIVLTAHEYKLLCANQTLFDDRSGTACTACVQVSAPRRVAAALSRSCIKASPAATVLGALEGLVSEPTWRAADPAILAPSQFMAATLVAGGWSPERVTHLDLPWRRADQPVTRATGHGRDAIVFLGRLVPLKGPQVALAAWQRIAADHPCIRLRILGGGPAEADLRAMVAREQIPRVDFLGAVGRQVIAAELTRALVTVHPSLCHENSPYTVRESLMAGVPAIVSALGGMPEMVTPATGYVVPAGDVDAWARAMSTAAEPGAFDPDALVTSVTGRAMTHEAHLEVLQDTLAGRHLRQGTPR
ncbi:MAG: glycosyltransferase [Nostocoides sp.]